MNPTPMIVHVVATYDPASLNGSFWGYGACYGASYTFEASASLQGEQVFKTGSDLATVIRQCADALGERLDRHPKNLMPATFTVELRAREGGARPTGELDDDDEDDVLAAAGVQGWIAPYRTFSFHLDDPIKLPQGDDE